MTCAFSFPEGTSVPLTMIQYHACLLYVVWIFDIQWSVLCNCVFFFIFLALFTYVHRCSRIDSYHHSILEFFLEIRGMLKVGDAES